MTKGFCIEIDKITFSAVFYYFSQPVPCRDSGLSLNAILFSRDLGLALTGDSS